MNSLIPCYRNTCSKTFRLMFMLVLTLMFFVVEIISGFLTRSVALVADSAHMLSDSGALLIAIFSVRISKRKSSKNSFGWVRAEVLGALVNSVFLLALCVSIVIQAIKRFVHFEEIEDNYWLIIVGVVGLAINLVGLMVLHGEGHSHHHSHQHVHSAENLNHNFENEHKSCNGHHSHDSSNKVKIENTATNSKSASQMNMRGVILHVFNDALGSVVVIISGLCIRYIPDRYQWKHYFDPIMSMMMVALIVSFTTPLLKESSMILLQTVPTHIRVMDLQKKLIQQVKGVLDVNEFHIWQLSGEKIIASAHIKCQNLNEYMCIAEEVKRFFHGEGIHSTTIQPEFIDNGVDKDISQAYMIEQIMDCSKNSYSEYRQPLLASYNDNCMENNFRSEIA